MYRSRISTICLPLMLVIALIGCDTLSGPDVNHNRQSDSDNKAPPPTESISSSTSDIWVTAYLASWKHYAPPGGNWGNLPTDEIDWSAFTHMNYFAYSVNSDGSLFEPAKYENLNPDRLETIVAAAHEHNKPILFSIGGWGNYQEFSSAISDANRSNLVNSIIDEMHRWNFDGVDIDMEPIKNSDHDNYIAFINELYTALQSETTPLRETPLLVAAAGRDAELFSQVYDKFDQINIMTYDYSGAWEGWVTWHNAAVYSGGHTFESTGGDLPSANRTVNKFIDAGVPKSKIGIGIDFYGYVWDGVSEPLQGWDTPPDVTANVPFHDIMNTYYTDQRYHWDSGAEAAYLSINNSNGEKFVSYDNARTVNAKIRYIRDKGLGGAILWEIGGGYREDQPEGERDVLLQTVKDAVMDGADLPSDPGDTTPPSVSLTNPAEGTTVSGTVTLQAEANDNETIDRVQFLVDQQSVGSASSTTTSSSNLYEISWSSTDVSNGSHSIEARAVDNAGNTQSETISINVDNSDTGSSLAMYDDQLVSPWIDVSWSAEVNTQSTQQVYDGSRSIRLDVSSWGALSLRHGAWGSATDAISTDGYDAVSLAVYYPDQQGSLIFWLKDDQGNVIQSVDVGSVEPGSWKTVSLPLSKLNPDNKPVRRLSLQESSGGSRTLYIDELKFTGGESDGGGGGGSLTLSAPDLNAPQNGASGLSRPVTLQWGSVSDAETYDLQISTQNDFSTTVDEQSGLSTTSFETSVLKESTTYYWRVRAAASDQTGDWSSTYSFATQSLNESVVLYGDQLVDPWINTSWNADINTQSTRQVHSGTYALRVNTDSWGAFSTRHGEWGTSNAVSTNGFSKLRFDVYFTDNTGQFQVWMKDESGSTIEAVSTESVSPGSWTTISIPMDQLNPNREAFLRLSMQETSGASRTFYIDELRME